jgi:hypothetical protein
VKVQPASNRADKARALYYALDERCLITGAWSDMHFADLPEHVVEQLMRVVDALEETNKT